MKEGKRPEGRSQVPGEENQPHSNALAPHHRRLLEAAAIPAEVAVAAGARSISTVADLPEPLRWCKTTPGLLFHAHPLDGPPVPQYRPDKPVEDADGKVRKYLFPKGAGSVLNIVPTMRPRVSTASKVVIVEGTKQVLAAVAAAPDDVLVVGIGGCWSWSHDGCPIPELDQLGLDGKQVVVALDADVATNSTVHGAAKRLGDHLDNLGAEVSHLHLPAAGNTGLDDYLASVTNRAAVFARLVDKAGKLGRRPKAKPRSDRPASINSGAHGKNPLPAPNQPLDVAERLVVEQLRKHNVLVLRCWRGAFWRWDQTRWVELEDAAVRTDLYGFTGSATYLDKDGSEQPWAPNRYKIADLVDALRAITHLPETFRSPAWLTNTPGAPPAQQLVATTNGLLDVTTRELHAHTPTFFNQVAVPFAYQADAAEPERRLAFLNELWPEDPDSIAALQEYMGYVISSRVDLQKILLLIGPTRAGKGVIARVLKNLVGDGNHAGPTLASLATNFGLSPLIGKPLAIISDARLAGAGTNQVVERLLSISGEDVLTIDRKYREPWTGTLPTRFVVISNELPRFGDASGAIAGRFVVLSLQNSFLGRENPRLTNELLVELPSILNWALDGLERLLDTGRFTEPQSSVDSILALQDLVSPVAAFVRDRCTRGPSEEVPIAALYEAWKSWADDNGHRVISLQTFGRDMRAVVPGLSTVQPREGGKRERHYRGIRLGTQTHIEVVRVPPRATSQTEKDLARDGTRTNPMSAHVNEPDGDGDLFDLPTADDPGEEWL